MDRITDAIARGELSEAEALAAWQPCLEQSVRPQLECNGLAQIHGLVSRAELNGRRASLLAYNDRTSRWAVMMHGNGVKIQCKAMNLLPISPPAPELSDAVLLNTDFLSVMMSMLGLRDVQPAAKTCNLWHGVAQQKLAEWRVLQKCADDQYLVDIMPKSSFPYFPMPHPPTGISLAPDGSLACTSHGLQLLALNDGAWKLTRAIGCAEMAANDDEDLKWEHPKGVVFDGRHLFVTDAPDFGVRKIDSLSGEVLVENSDMYSPACLAVVEGAWDGIVFVIHNDDEAVRRTHEDSVTCSAYRSSDLELVCTFGSWSCEHHIGYHGGLAGTSSRLFVSEPLEHRIDVFDISYVTSGLSARPFTSSLPTLLTSFGEKGTRPGQFLEPRGLAVLHERLLVAEFAGQRVQVLSLEGTPLQVIGVGCGASLSCICTNGKMVVAGGLVSVENRKVEPQDLHMLGGQVSPCLITFTTTR